MFKQVNQKHKSKYKHKMVYSVKDIVELYKFYENRVKTAPATQQPLIAQMLNGLDDVVLRITLQVFDQHNLYVDGLSSALPARDRNAVAAIAAKNVTETIEVTSKEDQHIQDAVIVGEVLVKNDKITNPSIATLLEESTFNLLKRKLQKGRVKDTVGVIESYLYYYKDMLQSGELTVNTLLDRIEEETNCHPFNSIRNTVTQIAITRNSDVKQHAKFPGWPEALDYVMNALPGFKEDKNAARIFVENSTKQYATEMRERIQAKREERNNKRENYEEKGYKK